MAQFIDVPISLSVDDHTRHWLYFNEPRTDTEKRESLHKDDHGGAQVLVTQAVRNGRGQDLKLDDTSFELVDIPTNLSTDDFYQLNTRSGLLERYHTEVEAFVMKHLKCDKVYFLHHQVRNAEKQGTAGVEGYAGAAPHTDASGVSGDLLAMQILAQHGDSASDYKRYMYLNLWRNISEDPIENNHLAVLDERTVAKPDDYVVKDLFGPGYHIVQYGLNARHAANHQWYYFPRMKKDEGLLFKQVDSDFTKPSRTCFHMSVSSRTAPEDAKTRQSIELRMFCFWKDAAVDSMPREDNMYLKEKRDPRQLARGGGGALKTATLRQLAAALLGRLLLAAFGARGLSVARRLIGAVLRPLLGVTTLTGLSQDWRGLRDAKAPSGELTGLVPKFISSVENFPSWPVTGRAWASGVIRSAGLEEGIVSLTRTLVSDSTGHHGTKGLPAEQQQDVVELLLADAAYMDVARKHFGPIAAA